MRKYTIITDVNDDNLISHLSENKELTPSFFIYNVNYVFLLCSHTRRFEMLPNLDETLLRNKNIILIIELEKIQILQFDGGSYKECISMLQEDMEYTINKFKNKYKHAEFRWELLIKDKKTDESFIELIKKF